MTRPLSRPDCCGYRGLCQKLDDAAASHVGRIARALECRLYRLTLLVIEHPVHALGR